MNLLRLTPEGKIVTELAVGAKGYAELERLTELSDRRLSKKLKELTAADVVGLRDGRYGLTGFDVISDDPLALSYFKAATSPLGKARLIAGELGRDPRVLALVLFGSVAKKRGTEESDLDFVVISREGVELEGEVYELAFKYDVPVEGIFMSFGELLSHARERTALLLGVLEGYEVLYDRAGIEGILSFLKSEVKERFSYDEETEAWIQKSTPPALAATP